MTERRRALLQFVVLLVAALAVRLFLCGRFYGWEEGDYGNVMMVRKVLDTNFGWFPTRHMPAYYSLGAVVRWFWDSPRGSVLALTMALSCLNVGVAALLARKLVSPAAAWLVGCWLVVQPEMALYGSTTIRAPVYASIGFAGLALLVWGARDRGFGLVALTFLVRLEAAFALFPAALWGWARDSGRGLRGLVVPAAILGGVLVGWQVYITVGHGDALFFWSVLDINRAPDVHGGELGAFDWRGWFSEAFWSGWWMATWTLPRKLGWTWMVLAALGVWALWSGTGRPGSRTAVAFGVGSVGFFFASVLLSHHESNHNLYWSWMALWIPFLALLAAGGFGWIERRLAGAHDGLKALVFVLVLLSVAPAFFHEASYQMIRSEAWYRPQLELSTWLEEQTPPDTGVLVSSIPEVWLKRTPSHLRIYSWWTLPERAQDLDADEFGAFLAEERIDYVVWFVEEWNESARLAPWMAIDQNMTAGPVGLTAVDREPGYGWILYLVTRTGHPQPPVPPPYGQGYRGRGWSGVD